MPGRVRAHNDAVASEIALRTQGAQGLAVEFKHVVHYAALVSRDHGG